MRASDYIVAVPWGSGGLWMARLQVVRGEHHGEAGDHGAEPQQLAFK